jgi:hypothetical protein
MLGGYRMAGSSQFLFLDSTVTGTEWLRLQSVLIILWFHDEVHLDNVAVCKDVDVERTLE